MGWVFDHGRPRGKANHLLLRGFKERQLHLSNRMNRLSCRGAFWEEKQNCFEGDIPHLIQTCSTKQAQQLSVISQPME